MTDQEERRCRRGARCALRTAVADDRGNTVGYVGAPLDTADGLCRSDTRNVHRALGELPELYRKLDDEQLPGMAVRYKEIDISSPGKLHPPIPIDGYIDAVQRLVDHELSVWSAVLADVAGLRDTGEWDTVWGRMSRSHVRVYKCARLLDYRLDQWLTIGPVTYLARSLSADPEFGHDEAQLSLSGTGEWLVTRDALDAACVVLDLHRRARELFGEQATIRSPLPCRNCGSRNVFRNYAAQVWICDSCQDRRSTDGHRQDAQTEVDARIRMTRRVAVDTAPAGDTAGHPVEAAERAAS